MAVVDIRTQRPPRPLSSLSCGVLTLCHTCPFIVLIDISALPFVKSWRRILVMLTLSVAALLSSPLSPTSQPLHHHFTTTLATSGGRQERQPSRAGGTRFPTRRRGSELRLGARATAHRAVFRPVQALPAPAGRSGGRSARLPRGGAGQDAADSQPRARHVPRCPRRQLRHAPDAAGAHRRHRPAFHAAQRPWRWYLGRTRGPGGCAAWPAPGAAVRAGRVRVARANDNKIPGHDRAITCIAFGAHRVFTGEGRAGGRGMAVGVGWAGFVNVDVWVSMCVHVYVYVYVCERVCTCVSTWAATCLHVWKCVGACARDFLGSVCMGASL